MWLNIDRHIDGDTFKLLFLLKEKKQVTNLFISSIVVLHKVSNDISNIDHFVLINTNIVSKKMIDTQPNYIYPLFYHAKVINKHVQLHHYLN